MSGNVENEIQKCKCGRVLMVHEPSGVTMCPSEDAVQKVETNPNATFAKREVMIIDGQKVVNPFAPISTRLKTPFDYAHDAFFEAAKKEWYGH